MNCKETHEWLGIAIDSTLPATVKESFFQHLTACHGCKREFEMEAVTKHVVAERVHHSPTPAAVRQSVELVLGDEYRKRTRPSRFLDTVIGKLFPVPALAVGLTVLALLYFVSPTQHSQPAAALNTASNDVIAQTMQNFALIRDGKWKPALSTASAESASTFFSPLKLSFAVDVHDMIDCTCYGTMANDYQGVRLAHVVYKIGGNILYVYQTKTDDVLNGSVLCLPEEVKQLIAHGGWYSSDEHPECNVVVWDERGTLCVATSTMKKEKMMELLAER